MNSEHTKGEFSKRIRKNYDNFLKDCLSQEPEELVSYAEEISATKMLATALPETTSIENMEYLLQFENPLEVVRDGWMSYDSADLTNKLEHTLRTIRVNVDLLNVYAPSKEHLSTPKEPVTVRELLEQYPNDSFDMMTPGGFVYLTPDKAQKLLAGESVMGNPGCPGFDMEITADELLNQVVANADFQKGVWNLLSTVAPEQTQFGMEVTMC